MTRSRLRKLKRKSTVPDRPARSRLSHVPLATAMSAILAGGSIVHAQDRSTATLESVIVTAQKREENLQQVPLSIQTLNTEQLENMHVNDFNDYAKLLPSVAFQTAGPGFARIYMRGVSSGDNGNHSGSMPSVGMYLDEQPITTITGPLDLHIYDVARVEVLAGPQGTLYGASSEAGTIRIITNKPEVGQFKAGYDLQANTVAHGTQGAMAEGFVNLPIGSMAAIRLVGWAEHDAGYVDNVRGTRTYGTSGVTINNNFRASKDYNYVDTQGARAALKVDLSDSWTVTPAFMTQSQKVNGNFATDAAVGDLQLTHFYPESSRDTWTQAALTVEGKISNFDLVYAGAYLKRNVETHQDYSDYSFFYDAAYGGYIVDDSNNLINPSQYIIGFDHYSKMSHELRISSPKDWRVHFVAGLFAQRQVHDIEQRYKIDRIASSIEVTGWPDTLWLTEQQRVDRDSAAFGEVTFDITDSLAVTGGIRFFKAENSLEGFFGFGTGYSSSTGEAACTVNYQFHGGPCVNLPFTVVDETGNTPKINVTYKFDADRMVYATWSKGFRPGGVNRRGSFPPYKADFLTNYEAGWKTSWFDNRLRFNGAAFVENWKDFQFSFLGTNGLTNITNAGNARIRGIEADLSWAATADLRISAGMSFLDAKLSSDFCKRLNTSPCPADDFAPNGTQLPITPKFKGNLTARYEFNVGDVNAHVQGSFIYEGASRAALLPADSVFLKDLSASKVVDLSTGIDQPNYSVELFITNATDERVELYRYVECATQVCGPQPYTVTSRPRTIGVKFGQKF